HAREFDEVDLELLGEYVAQSPLTQQSELDEDVAEPLARAGLRRQRVAQLVFGNEAPTDEDLTQRTAAVTRTAFLVAGDYWLGGSLLGPRCVEDRAFGGRRQFRGVRRGPGRLLRERSTRRFRRGRSSGFLLDVLVAFVALRAPFARGRLLDLHLASRRHR